MANAPPRLKKTRRRASYIYSYSYGREVHYVFEERGRNFDFIAGERRDAIPFAALDASGWDGGGAAAAIEMISS